MKSCKSLFQWSVLAGLATSLSLANATEYDVDIVVDGLNRPTGIVTTPWYRSDMLYFTETPTPGVPGTEGGENTVKRVNLNNESITTISEGEPYPVNLAIDRKGRNVFWTCMTAGVILKYSNNGGKEFFLPQDPENDPFLLSPNGIAVDRSGEVLFTELPMPGEVGMNMVSASDGENITLLSDNEPAPTDIAISFRGDAYWTCNTAGVIIRRSPAGVISVLLSGLSSPTGIAVDKWSRKLYFTELPTPGVAGVDGGTNMVKELNLRTMEVSVIAEGFPEPRDVAVASNGTVYWTCSAAGVIAKGTPQ